MRNYRHIYGLLVIALWWQLPQAAGQGWRQFYGGAGSEIWQEVIALPSGGFAAAGFDNLNSPDALYFAIVDEDGDTIITTIQAIDSFYLYVSGLAALPTGGFLVNGTLNHPATNSQQAWMGRLDDNGILTDSYFLGLDSCSSISALVAETGKVAIVGSKFYYTGNQYDAFAAMADTAGNMVWTYDSGNPEFDTFYDLELAPDGGLWAVGYRFSLNSLTHDIFLARFDANGLLLWEREIDLGNFEAGYKLALTPEGDLAIAVLSYNDDHPTGFIQLVKADPDGNMLWSQDYAIGESVYPTDIEVDAAGNWLVLANYLQAPGGTFNIKLLITYPNGQLFSQTEYGGLGDDAAEDLLLLPNGLLIAGSSVNPDFSILGNAMLIRTDSLARLYTASLSGQVYRDQNADCMAGPGEPMLSAGIIVKAEPQQGGPAAYTVTDIDGHYNLFLDTGLYLISVLPPNNLWQTCANDIAIYLPEHDDSLTVDFGLQAVVDCPVWEVEAVTPFLRRCFDNNYAIRYCNTGTVASDGAVQVVLDPYFSYLGSSLPLTAQSGDTLLFAFDSLDVFECRQMTLQIHLDCDSTMLGQTHCLETRILPDTVCTPPPAAWDGADLQMSGVCLGDSVVVAISNTGTGDMSVASQYLVIEDQIMLRTGEIQLLSGQDTTLVFYPEGATLIVLVDQTPNHPDDEPAIAVIEGCGAPPFSTGFALQFPYDDSSPNFDIECRQNIGSYDPNAKSALPQGYGEDRRIATGTTIDYLIQFQNVGTDTAFRVVIRDTLSPWLDPETLRMGVASHDYTWKIVNNNILKIVFDPIALPDSSVNQAGSNGFVKFSVKLKENTPIDATINNRAGIYFDFNSPVITNTVSHTVGIEWLVTTAEEPAHTAGRAGLRIYPNPMHEIAQIDWSDGVVTSGELRLFDLNGRCRWRRNDVALPYSFANPGLSPGYYIMVLYRHNRPVAGSALLVR